MYDAELRPHPVSACQHPSSRAAGDPVWNPTSTRRKFGEGLKEKRRGADQGDRERESARSAVPLSASAIREPGYCAARLAAERPESASTGAMPATSPVPTETAAVNAISQRSGRRSTAARSPSPTARLNPAGAIHCARSNPSRPPAAPITSRLGQAAAARAGARPAPSANRSASSFWRFSARARNSPARLAQAIVRIKRADDDQDAKRRLERAAKARRGADRSGPHVGADVEIQALAPLLRQARQRGFSRLTVDRQ